MFIFVIVHLINLLFLVTLLILKSEKKSHETKESCKSSLLRNQNHYFGSFYSMND